MQSELTSGIGVRKKLFSISAIIIILCLTPMFIIWASAQTSDPEELTFTILSATANLKGKGNCFLARSGTIEADLPATYTGYDEKSLGGVTWATTYSYDLTPSLPLTLVEAIEVHIHIDGSFRRLIEGVPEDIIMLMISGCTEEPVDGVQYCVNAYADSEDGYIGTVTRTGPSAWYVDVNFLASDLRSPGMCVHEWIGGEPKEGFCIPLRDFLVVCSGTITN